MTGLAALCCPLPAAAVPCCPPLLSPAVPCPSLLSSTVPVVPCSPLLSPAVPSPSLLSPAVPVVPCSLPPGPVCRCCPLPAPCPSPALSRFPALPQLPRNVCRERVCPKPNAACEKSVSLVILQLFHVTSGSATSPPLLSLTPNPRAGEGWPRFPAGFHLPTFHAG